MRRLAIFSVVALAVIGVAFAVLPFHLPHHEIVAVEGLFYSGSGSCSAPVVSAFRNPRDGGWFGYAPLANTYPEVVTYGSTCRSEGQRRLQYGGMFILAAVVIAVAIRRERNDGGPSPNLAVP